MIRHNVLAKLPEQYIRNYQNRPIEAAAVFQEVIELARQTREVCKRGGDLELTEDELGGLTLQRHFRNLGARPLGRFHAQLWIDALSDTDSPSNPHVEAA